MKNATLEKLAEGGLQSIASFAAGLSQDIEQIYQLPIGCSKNLTIGSSSSAVISPMDTLSGGELLVVAARDKGLKGVFCDEVVKDVGIRQNLSMTYYNMSESYLRFSRRLIGDLADIPPEAGIYDGLLSESEIERLSSTLDELSRSHIYYINPIRAVSIDQMCRNAESQSEVAGGNRLILLNCLQHVVDSQFRLEEPRNVLIRLKRLARELVVPVVAMYQLDPTEGNYQSTLTRQELKKVRELVGLADGIVLLHGTPQNLVLSAPKLPVHE
ncbi:MAG: DnaB-like helicase C-terminal domain-containing protein [Sideroxydans sp.]|nr:DnaB-like helicase C-terminal domain-containing protein [Sideroxydans sp.]